MTKTIALIAAAVLTGCSTMHHEVHHGCKVLSKDMLYDTSSDGKGNAATRRTKRLSTSCGAFNVEDSIAGGFNSFDTWSQLEVGKTYDIETGGYRSGFFDAFPTVTKVTAR